MLKRTHATAGMSGRRRAKKKTPSPSMAMEDDEALTTTSIKPNKGGWKTFPFIIGTKVAVGVAVSGLSSNLTVYLIQQFHVASIKAAQISTFVGGSNMFSPVIGAIAADSGLGCFRVIAGASAASLLGTILFTLFATVPSLRPPPCSLGFCKPPTTWQLTILYTAILLSIAGLGGTRYVAATLGACQLDTAAEQATFFNWYVVAMYITVVVGLTVIVYIQASVSWAWGFGVCAILSAIGLTVFLLGSQYYRHPRPQKNPFLEVLFSVMPSRRKEDSSETDMGVYTLIEDGSTGSEGLTTSISDTETTEEDREDHFSSLIRLIPLMSSGIPIAMSTSLITSLAVLQALVMDCDIGPNRNFTIPASSMSVFTYTAPIISVPLLQLAIFPLWIKLSHHEITPLQRIGIGYLIAIIATITAAETESKRLEALTLSNKSKSVLWLVPALVLVGLGESLHFPGTLALYHQEFPPSLKSLGTGVIAFTGGTGFYASTMTIALVRRFTPWLNDDTNKSRLDNVYYMMAVILVLDFVYFLVCAKSYGKVKKQKSEILK